MWLEQRHIACRRLGTLSATFDLEVASFCSRNLFNNLHAKRFREGLSRVGVKMDLQWVRTTQSLSHDRNVFRGQKFFDESLILLGSSRDTRENRT